MSDGTRRTVYAIDTNVLMDWQARHYPTDVFSTVPDRVDGLVGGQRFLAPALVREELEAVGTAELSAWARAHASLWIPTAELLAGALAIQSRFPGLSRSAKVTSSEANSSSMLQMKGRVACMV